MMVAETGSSSVSAPGVTGVAMAGPSPVMRCTPTMKSVRRLRDQRAGDSKRIREDRHRLVGNKGNGRAQRQQRVALVDPRVVEDVERTLPPGHEAERRDRRKPHLSAPLLPTSPAMVSAEAT